MSDNTINPFIQQQEISQTTAEYTRLMKAENQRCKITIVAFGCIAISLIGLIGCITSLSIGAYGLAFPFSLILGGGAVAAYILRIPAEAIYTDNDAQELFHLDSTIDPDWVQTHSLTSKAIVNSQGREVGRTVTTAKTVEFFEMQALRS